MTKTYTLKANALRAARGFCMKHDMDYLVFEARPTDVTETEFELVFAGDMSLDEASLVRGAGYKVQSDAFSACASETSMLTTKHTNSNSHESETTMDIPVTSTDDRAAAIELATTNLATAEIAVTAVETALATAKTTKTEHGKSYTQAKAFTKAQATKVKAVPANTDEANHDEARATAEAAHAEAVTGEEQWKAAADAAVQGVKDAQDALKTAKATRVEAKKAVTAANKTAKPKVERVEQNGMKRPIDGGPSHKIWDAADAAKQALGRDPALGDILAPLEVQGIKTATVKAAYSHWRKFHGVTGRVMSEADIAAKQAKADEKAAAAKVAAEEKAAKAAEEKAAAQEPATAGA